MLRLFAVLLFTTLGSLTQAQIQWVRSTRDDYFIDFTVDKAGNSYLTGTTYFAKYRTDGSLVWIHDATGGSESIGVRSVADNSGNMYVAGYYEDGFSTQPPFVIENYTFADTAKFSHIFLVKFDCDTGALIWAKDIGGSGSSFVSDLTIDDSANVYLIGSYDQDVNIDGVNIQPSQVGGGFWGAYFLVKFDKNGTLKMFDPAICQINSKIGVDQNNDVVIAGDYQNTAYCADSAFLAMGAQTCIEKLSATGTRKWIVNNRNNRGYGQRIIDFVLDEEGNIYLLMDMPDTIFISGNEVYLPRSGAYVMMLNPNGVFQWATPVDYAGDTYHMYGSALYLSPSDSVHCVAQRFRLDTVIIPQYPFFAIDQHANGVFDITLNKQSGDTLNAFPLDEVIDGGHFWGIKNDIGGNLYMHGSYNSSIMFGADTLNSIYYGTYLLKYAIHPTDVNSMAPEAVPFLVGPIPAGNTLFIMPQSEANYTTSLFDLSGRQIKAPIPYIGNGELDISSISGGIYLLELRDFQNHYYHKKIVKQ